jgi:hypothetical protein
MKTDGPRIFLDQELENREEDGPDLILIFKSEARDVDFSE